MSNPLPNSLALSVINTNDPINSAPPRNNNAAIQTAVNQLIACLGGGTAGQILQAVDGTDVQWGILPGQILVKGKRTTNVTTTATTFAGGADLLAADLTFTADGTSDYAVVVTSRSWAHSVSGSVVQANIKLDGADGGEIGQIVSPSAGVGDAMNVEGVISAPAAGSHTVNVRIFLGAAGTGTIVGGTGGVGGNSPLLVKVIKLG